jgi:serine/threonine-protein kinase RsbW
MSQRCDVRIEVPATANEVGLIRRSVLEAAETQGFDPALRDDIGLAVSEACANVVMHAYRDEPAPGPLTVEIHSTNGEFVVVVSDEGLGIAPRTDSPGLGLGLALIARLAHRLEIGANGGDGAKLTMAFAAARTDC